MSKVVKCKEDDPHRCQGSWKTGQCPNLSVHQTNYCSIHQPGSAQDPEIKEMDNYRLSKWQQRVNEFAANSNVKSLREEIGITRLILEEIINQCHESTDLILYSSKISDLVMKIEKLVSSCHRLEFAVGSLLDKSTIINISNEIVNIISQHVKDPDQLETISIKMVDRILHTQIPNKKEVQQNIHRALSS